MNIINPLKKIINKDSYCEYKNEDNLLIGKGFTIDDIERKNFIDIRQLNSNRKGHTLTFGTTRVGKTRLAENMIMQDIEQGHNVVIIDPKIDTELFSNIYMTALKCDRKDDFMLVSSVFPDYSIKFNPLSHFFIYDEIISTIMSGVPADDQFFYDMAYTLTSVVVRSILKIKEHNNKPKLITYNEVAEHISYEQILKLKDLMEEFDDDESKIITNIAKQVLEGKEDYFGKVSSTIKVTLVRMTTGNLGRIVGNIKKNIIIDRLENNKGLILFIQTGAMIQGESANLLGKTIVSMFQNLVGRFFASGKKFQIPLCLFLDEMSNLVYHGIEDMFNKAGGCECYITGFTQSPADIIAVVGEDKARKIFDNTNTKIIMRMNDIESAKLMVEYGGTIKKYTPQLTLDGNIRSTETEEDAIEHTEFLRMKPREFFYFGFEGNFRGKTAPVEPQNLLVQFPSAISNRKKESVIDKLIKKTKKKN